MPIRRDLNRKTANGRRIFGTALEGVPGRAVPATGDAGRAGYLYASLERPADDDVLVSGEILTRSAGLLIDADEDTSFTATGPNGAHWFTFQPRAAGLPVGGPLTVEFALSGNGDAVLLSATATAQSAFTAQLLRGVRMAGAAAGRASANAEPTLAVALSASAQASTASGGQISITAAVVGFGAAALAQAGASASIALRLDLSAAAIAQATAHADPPPPAADLQATAIAHADSGAALWLDIPLTAEALAVVASGAALMVETGFAAAALAQASVGAQLRVFYTLSADGAARSSMTAGLLVVGSLDGAHIVSVPQRRRNWRVRRFQRTAA